MFVNNETLRLDYQVEASDDGLKVIDVLATSMDISSRLIRKCKNYKMILLNGRDGSVNRLVHEGDIISLILDHDENTFDPSPMDIQVIFEDADCLVVNKPPFLVVHPTKGHPEGTLANGLSHYQYTRGQNYKIRFINRLDRDTSGVLLIAKNAFSQQRVSDQMLRNDVDKGYYAIVEGIVKDDRGTIDLPIERIEDQNIQRVVRPDGLQSVTHYEVLERFAHHTLLKLKLETGRTHQIRVHLSHIGHPVVGDSLYGHASEWINRQALHCYEMCFVLPRGSEKKTMTAPMPEDMNRLLNLVRTFEKK